MRSGKRFSVSLISWLFLMGNCAHAADSQTPLKVIDNPEGGKIIYGLVDGATSPAGAMAEVLRSLHKNCVAQPQVGQLFKARGTNSAAVFFTVVDHSQGNKAIAGLLIAAPSSSHQFDAALVSDDAAHFGSTVNIMLKRLFDAWRPDGWGDSLGSETDARFFPAGNSAPVGPLHTVILSDGTAKLGLPEGWKLDPGSGGGTAAVAGSRGERIGLNLCWTALEPDSSMAHLGPRNGTSKTFYDRAIVYSYKVDPVKAFPDIFQQMRHTNGLPPTELHIAHAEPISAPSGERCVHVTGTLDPDGKGTSEMDTMMCATKPGPSGMYVLRLFHTLLPVAVADQERATAAAVVASYQVNTALMQPQTTVRTVPTIDVQPIGATAAAQYAALLAENARNNQGLRKYILDQAVIPDDHKHGESAVWNSMADALVKANPSRYEFVGNPDFWQGVDY